MEEDNNGLKDDDGLISASQKDPKEETNLLNDEWLGRVINQIKKESNLNVNIRNLANAMLIYHSKRLIKILKCDKAEINYMVKLAKWIERQK